MSESGEARNREADREISKNAPLRERIADELAHNDECGPGPVSWQEYLADADAILRIVGERSPKDEAGRRRYPMILTGEAATAARHAEHDSPQGEGHEEGCKFTFVKRDLDVLCESLWHSLSRADVPDEDIDVMRGLRERLNDARR